MRRKSVMDLSAGQYLQRKKRRYDLVMQGKWRANGGKELDLYDKDQVPIDYLETIISNSAEREKIDRTGIDEKIMNQLLKIREQRNMKNEQLELNISVGAAKAAANIKTKGAVPRLFNVGDLVGSVEILLTAKSNLGNTGGWSYKVRHRKNGKMYWVKQSTLSKCKVHKRADPSQTNPFFVEEAAEATKSDAAAPKKKIKSKSSKKTKFPKNELLRAEFPRVRSVNGKRGTRYTCDSRYGPNGYKGTLDWFDDKEGALYRANDIANNLILHASSRPTGNTPPLITVDAEIKKLTFIQRLKMLFL